MAEEQKTNSIPLSHIDYKASVVGLFAEVTATQHFENYAENPIEAVYVFPLPEEASVVGCQMQIGDRRIEAELKEKDQARQEYDDAVSAGHHGALLEQKRPNIFTMNVGGIEPGQEISVTVTYNQPVPWQDNGGRFNIPLVVAPRFIPGQPTGQTGGGWSPDTDLVPDASQITPQVSQEGVPYQANIEVQFQPGFDCDVESPSHELLIQVTKATRDESHSLNLQNLTPDRDFILCYRTNSPVAEQSVHQGHFDNEAFVYLTVMPPLQTGSRPKDVVLCLDVSGSMGGAKIEGLKVVAEKAVRKLQSDGQNHRVAVVAFESAVHEVHSLAEISETTFQAIANLQSMGGTMAGAAINHCLDLLSNRQDKSREAYILLVSDGQTEDRWNPTKAAAKTARVICAGIDAAVNASYLRDIARETGGTSIGIYPGEDYDRAANTLKGFLSGPVLTDLKLYSEGQEMPDVVGGTTVYMGMPATMSVRTNQLPAGLELRGQNPLGGQETYPVDLTSAQECSFAHQIWAREKLRGDVEPAQQLALSLQYGVLCNQTAFVAISLKDVPGQTPERVEIPVALPHTWDYNSVFGGPNFVGFMALGATTSIRRMRGGPVLYDTLDSGTKGLLPTLPTATPTPQPTPTNSLVSDLERLLEELEVGAQRRTTEHHWSAIRALFNQEDLNTWSEVDRAKCLYLLLKVRSYGFDVPRELLVNFLTEPRAAEAHQWWEKAQSYMGVAR